MPPSKKRRMWAKGPPVDLNEPNLTLQDLAGEQQPPLDMEEPSDQALKERYLRP